MKVFVVLCAIGLACAFPKTEWEIFKARHNKAYKNDFEEHFRMNVFLENKLKIEEHNAKFQRGEVSFDLKMNQFGDLTAPEVKARMNGYLMNATAKGQSRIFVATNEQLPDSVDWRTKGAVTDVKNQKSCGACWAFSSTGSLEGQHFLKTGKLVSLSEQNLIDCSYENGGCSGGLMTRAFTFVNDNQGIDTEASYPYVAQETDCRFSRLHIGATDTGYTEIPTGDEEALKNAVATIGPISVGIDASSSSFAYYSTGIYSDDDCSSRQLDHAVLVVGYGTEEGQDYWLVKNSWDTTWGESGYIKMARNKDNACGIATAAVYPNV